MPRMVRILSLCSFVSILAACGGTSGNNPENDAGPTDSGLPDSGTDAGSPDSGTDGGPRTVSATLQTVYVTDDGARVVKPGWDPDIGGFATVTGLVIPDSTQPSGYQTIPVTVGADSTFSVAGVPAGPYFIQIDLGSAKITTAPPSAGTQVAVFDRMLFEASTSTPDLSMVLAKRADAPPESVPGGGDTVLLSFAGLAPVSSQDSFRFFASQSLLNASFSEGSLRPVPTAGATQISSSISWDSKAFGARPDASKHDVEWVLQRKTQALDGGVTKTEVEAFAKVSDFTFVDGGPNTITATFAVPPQTGTLPGGVTFSAFETLGAAVHPGATGSTDPSAVPSIGIDGVAHTLTFPNQPIGAMPGPPLLLDFEFDTFSLIDQGPTFFQFKSLSFASPAADVTLSPATYPQFLDSNWKDVAQVLYFWDVPLAVSAGGPLTITGGAFYRAFIPPAQLPDPLVPQLGPPSAPQINGADAFAFQSGVGTQPVVSWSAPALGTATKYYLTVARADSAFKTNDISSVTVVLYDRTSFKLPDGFLKTGSQYYGAVTAMSSADRLNDPILGLGSPRIEVNTVFGLFQP